MTTNGIFDEPTRAIVELFGRHVISRRKKR